MATRSLAVLGLALAGTLCCVSVAGAARNGPIAWEQLPRSGPVIVESESAGGPIRDLLAGGGTGVFSPTGDRYAYHHSASDGHDRVWVAHLLGGRAGDREALLGGGEHQGFRISDWSPDGARVLYYYENNYGREDVAPLHQLETVGVAPGSGSIPVIPSPRGLVPFAGGSFFPDSQTIVFSAELQLVGPGLAALFRSHYSGRDVTPIPTDLKLDGIDGVPRDPAVSPDGTKIAYSLDLSPRRGLGAEGDLASLVVINADGSGRHVLTHGHRDTRPQWSPDGRMLTFQRQTRLLRDCGSGGSCYYEYEVFVIGADGSGEVNFSNDPPYNFAPDWRPARPGSSSPAPPLVTLLADGASLPLAPGKPLSLQVVCPKGPRNCAGVTTLMAGKHVVLKKRFLLRAGRSQRLRARVKGKLLRTKRARSLRLVTKAKHRRVRTRRVRLKPSPGLSLGCPATGVAGSPLLFQGRLRAPGARRTRVLRAHFENEVTGAAIDQDVRAAKGGVYALMAPLPSDGPWSATLAWAGDRSVLGRAINCRVVLRGPPRVQITRPGEAASVVADTDLALEGAASDTAGRQARRDLGDRRRAGRVRSGADRPHPRPRAPHRHAQRHQWRRDLGVGGDRHRCRAPGYQAVGRDHRAQGRRLAAQGPDELHRRGERPVRRVAVRRLGDLARPLRARRRNTGRPRAGERRPPHRHALRRHSRDRAHHHRDGVEQRRHRAVGEHHRHRSLTSGGWPNLMRLPSASRISAVRTPLSIVSTGSVVRPRSASPASCASRSSTITVSSPRPARSVSCDDVDPGVLLELPGALGVVRAHERRLAEEPLVPRLRGGVVGHRRGRRTPQTWRDPLT